MRVSWTRLALADLKSAHDFIAEDKPGAAAQVVELIEKSIAMLERHPSLGRSGRVEKTRELVVSGVPFVIVYRARKERLEILAVIHSSRRWPDAF